MADRVHQYSRQASLIPGQAIFRGEKKQDEVIVTCISYNDKKHDVYPIYKDNLDDFVREPGLNHWINADGLHDANLVNRICKDFGIHSLIIEDILNTSQRPKLVVLDDAIFLVMNMLFKEDNDEISSEQVSFILKEDILLTFQEKTGDVFGPVRERLKDKLGRIRERKLDYLMYALIDSIVDDTKEICDDLGVKIEALDAELFKQSSKELLTRISDYKLTMNLIISNTRPNKDSVLRIDKLDNSLIKPDTQLFLNDLSDLANHVNETAEYYKTMLSEQLMIYSTNVANRMNDIMKVLTIFSAIFIPLTFIAGIYGMNFNNEASKYNMPELNSQYGYFIVWGVMILVALAMLKYFKHKKWI